MSAFNWNKGGWLGAQLGGTCWLFILGVLIAPQDPLAGAVTLFCFGDPTADTLRGYRDLGAVRVVLGSGREGWHDPDTTYPFLDRYTPLVDELS